ncbi:MAG TPA: DUF2157 domain-containing protein, partial [Actinobacteria bacterium]|nr:DUF2157 domain-containing protein [Actinomycetota bacterium]
GSMRDLDERLARWKQAELISDEQAAAIIRFEAGEQPHRSTLIAEVLGYLGGVLAIVALWVFIAQFWGRLEIWAQLTLIGVLTVGFIGAGAWSRTGEGEAVRRLSSFLWFLGIAGIAGWFGVFSDQIIDVHDDLQALWITVPTFIVAALLWKALPRLLQVVALIASVHAVVLSALAQFDPSPTEWFGLIVWGIGVATVLLTWGETLQPTGTSYGLGIVAILIGPSMAAGMLDTAWPLWLGLISAAVLLAVSVPLREVLLLIGGAGAIFVFLPQLIFTYFEKSLGIPVALFLSGVVLIGAALLIAKLREEVTGA